MKNFYLLFFLVFGILSCQPPNDTDGADEQSLEDLQEEMNSLKNELEGTDENDWHTYFDLKVPAPMQEMDGLNQEAIAQYSYVEEVPLENNEMEVREHYLIVMMEEKEAIKGYPVELEVDIESYNDDAIESMRKGERIENFTILSQSSEVEKINDADCIKTEIEASIISYSEPVQLYYQLGVFETERAFYQVITWCIGDQRSLFKTDMERIVNSFREK